MRNLPQYLYYLFQAYRLEPLILKHYSNISPVQIHWWVKFPASIKKRDCVCYLLLQFSRWWVDAAMGCLTGSFLLAGTTPPVRHRTIRSGPHCSTPQRRPRLSQIQRASPARAPHLPRPDGTTESPSPIWARPASWVSKESCVHSDGHQWWF